MKDSQFMYWITFYNRYTAAELTITVRYSDLTDDACTEWDALKIASIALKTYCTGDAVDNWYNVDLKRVGIKSRTENGPTIERYSNQFMRERYSWDTGLFYKKVCQH